MCATVFPVSRTLSVATCAACVVRALAWWDSVNFGSCSVQFRCFRWSLIAFSSCSQARGSVEHACTEGCAVGVAFTLCS
jgi:hypothetical protein